MTAATLGLVGVIAGVVINGLVTAFLQQRTERADGCVPISWSGKYPASTDDLLRVTSLPERSAR